jgi:hypothetical protein
MNPAPCCCTCHDLQEQQMLFEVMGGRGIPLRYTHCMAAFMPEDEFAYAARLVSLAGASPQTHVLCTNDRRGSNPGGQLACSCKEVSQEQEQQQQQQGSDAASMHGSKQGAGANAALQHSTQQQQQQAGPPDLVDMPAWLKDLACLTAGNILSRPDTFRCVLAQAACLTKARLVRSAAEVHVRDGATPCWKFHWLSHECSRLSYGT